MMVKLGEVCEQLRGVSYDKSQVQENAAPGYVPVLRANNIQENGLHFADLVYVPKHVVKDKQLLRSGDIVIAASSGSKEVVGKAAQVKEDSEASFGAFCKLLRPNKKVDVNYFAHFFNTPDYRRKISALSEGANINNLKNEHLNDLDFLLPPLPTQRRIAAVLDKAQSLVANDRRTLAVYDQLAKSLFLEMFGDPVRNERGWGTQALGDLADVVSGVMKGKKYGNVEMVEAPYLRVANVHDGRLDLDVIKTIVTSRIEYEKYLLKKGDVVLTEGGDPDKLGRGAVWNEQVPNCIHQNHIYRVRLDANLVTPEYFSALCGHAYGKRYFLRASKQTTGIATVNLTQLKGYPVLLPPVKVQRKFSEALKQVELQTAIIQSSLRRSEGLFGSLLQRAFDGELGG